MRGRPGRPRATGEASGVRDTAGDVLTAAAALFCTVGYTATTTRAIADGAGVRQATMYHHFAGKREILRALLVSTVRPSLDLADALAARPEPAVARLWALCSADVELLCSGPVNLGTLYLLPEVAGAEPGEYLDLRARLRRRYVELVTDADRLYRGRRERPAGGSASGRPATGGPAVGAAALVMALVESVILLRRDEPGLRATEVAPLVADSALRLLGYEERELAEARVVGRRVLSMRAGQTWTQRRTG